MLFQAPRETNISACINLFCALFCADVMVGMGYNLEEIQDSLAKMKYDEITATYLLLGRKASEVQMSACYCHSASQWIAVPREKSALGRS